MHFTTVDRLIKLSIVTVQEDNVKAAESMINQIIQLKTTLNFIPDLVSALKNIKCQSLKTIREELLRDERYEQLLAKITSVIDVEAQSARGGLQFLQRMYAVKSGVNELLDITRKKYSELVDKIRGIFLKSNFSFVLSIRCYRLH